MTNTKAVRQFLVFSIFVVSCLAAPVGLFADEPKRLNLALGSVNATLVEPDANGAELLISGKNLGKAAAFKIDKPLSIAVNLPGHAQEHPELHSFPGKLINNVRVLSYNEDLKLVLDLLAPVEPSLAASDDSVTVKIVNLAQSDKSEAAAPKPATEAAAAPETDKSDESPVPALDTEAPAAAEVTTEDAPAEGASAADGAPKTEVAAPGGEAASEIKDAAGLEAEGSSLSTEETKSAGEPAPADGATHSGDKKEAALPPAADQFDGGTKAQRDAAQAPTVDSKEDSAIAVDADPASAAASDQMAALKTSTLKINGQENTSISLPEAAKMPAPAEEDLSVPQTLKSVTFELRDEASKTGPMVKLSLTRRPELLFSKKNSKTYVLSLKNCSLPATINNLPFFPPAPFAPFTAVHASQSGSNAEVSITTETPIRLAYSVRGTDILLSELQK